MVGTFFPEKTCEIHGHHLDSTKWNGFKFRDDDIIIATYAKTGTTWTQQIVGQLLFNGDPDIPVSDMSHWVDLRVPPKEVSTAIVEAQTHRRFLKTHLHLYNLVFSPKAKYLYVCRDGRDVAWSLHNHYAEANEKMYELLNKTPGLVGDPMPVIEGMDVKEMYDRWMADDGWPLWSYWENVRSWWPAGTLPNVLFIHFNDLIKDLPREIRRIAKFLDIPIDEAKFPTIVEHCTFKWVRNNPKCTPLGGALWKNGCETFLHKGTNGRWTERLTPEEVAAYEQRATKELGDPVARWTMEGGHLEELNI
eukprot:jgi/Mesvir1/23686/Mv18640-RA.1